MILRRRNDDCRRLLALAAAALLCGACQPGHLAADEVEPSSPRLEAEIRAARSHFNQAIEARDPAALAGLFAPDYHLVTGRGDQFHGSSEHVELWRQTFRDDPTFGCQRTPERIDVNPEWGLAQETGRWICTQTVDGEPGQYAGVYAARWQRAVDSKWLLQSEVFTTLTCDGPAAACRPPDPVS